MDKDPYKVLQSLLPGLSRLEAKLLCHRLCYQPDGKLTIKPGIVLQFKTVLPNDMTVDSMSISKGMKMQEILVLEKDKR